MVKIVSDETDDEVAREWAYLWWYERRSAVLGFKSWIEGKISGVDLEESVEKPEFQRRGIENSGAYNIKFSNIHTIKIKLLLNLFFEQQWS